MNAAFSPVETCDDAPLVCRTCCDLPYPTVERFVYTCRNVQSEVEDLLCRRGLYKPATLWPYLRTVRPVD